MKKLMVLMAAIAALGVMAVSASAASAATVTLHKTSKTGEVLKSGTAIKALSSGSTALKFSTAAGNLECAESEFTGTVGTNPGEPATVNVTAGAFRNSTGGAECKTTIAGGAATAEIKLTGLPWKITLESNGKSSITGTPVVDFKATLRAGGKVVGVCDYERSPVSDTFNFNTALVDVIPSQVFKLNVLESTGECAPEGSLAGSLSLTTGGVVVVATTP